MEEHTKRIPPGSNRWRLVWWWRHTTSTHWLMMVLNIPKCCDIYIYISWDSTNYQRSKMIRKMTVLVTNGRERKSIYHYSLQWWSYDMIAIQNFDNKNNLKLSPEIVTRTPPISEMVKPIPIPHYDLSIIELRYHLSNWVTISTHP